MYNRSLQANTILVLLRICTFLLAAVSFWATAQGMINYTFPEDWQGYAASLGIQGLLLGLNFSLPSFLKHCETKLQQGTLLALATVVLFCSSWFSYLYIAGQAYGDSWETECRLLAQAGYRQELFNADAYVNLYTKKLQEDLTEQVTSLYDSAKKMDGKAIDTVKTINWNTERNTYAPEGSTLRDLMSTVIDAMENGTANDTESDVHSQASTITQGMQKTLQEELESIKRQITDIDRKITDAVTTLRDAERNSGLNSNAYRSANNNYNMFMEEKSKLEADRIEYENALQRVNYYLTVLGMKEDGISSYHVGTNLRAIQQELFQTTPDYEEMQRLASDIFERLQSAVDITDDAAYQDVLTGMNGFIQSLSDYSALKEANVSIQEKLSKLENGTILSLNTKNNTKKWVADWIGEFNDLKSKISGLPVYTLGGFENRELKNYDRLESTDNLDQTIRYYLTDHNAAQQGLIYLISPYRQVAVFSLFLALLLDIAAFITGVIIDRVSSKETNADSPAIWKSSQQDENSTWNKIQGLNRYIFLTGDYSFLDGITRYIAIENGEETELEYQNKDMKAGLYRWHDNILHQLEEADLLYKGIPGDPQDGVYLNCSLCYEEPLLSIDKDNKQQFLGNIDPFTPVYHMSEEQYDVLPARDIPNIDPSNKKIVIALTRDGTSIAAIYVVY